MKNFDENLKRLEEINNKLSNADLSLDDAQNLFKEGIELANKLENHLNCVEKSIEILIEGDENKPPKTEKFS